MTLLEFVMLISKKVAELTIQNLTVLVNIVHIVHILTQRKRGTAMMLDGCGACLGAGTINRMRNTLSKEGYDRGLPE